MAIQEINVFPQTTYSEGQGQIGVRKWVLDPGDDIDAFTLIVCESHWPGQPDSIPIKVDTGAFYDGVLVSRDCASPRTVETLGDLPKYSKRLVVAQYALHRMTNCWPITIRKPWHPEGTTLTLRVKGSGQVLLVSPAGLRAVPPSAYAGEEGVALGRSIGTRIIMPIAEYHITCDRMTEEQVDTAQARGGGGVWDSYLGCVNENPGWEYDFLNAEAGTLLFDGYELTESNVCHPTDSRRWKFTAVLKRRLVLDESGLPVLDCDGIAIGWNHDFVNVGGQKQWGWRYIKMLNSKRSCEESSAASDSGATNGDIKPRYPDKIFEYLFGGTVGDILGSDQACEESESESVTELNDADICEN